VGLTTPAAPVAPQGIADAETLAKLVFASLDDSKAEDIVSIDIHAKSSLADLMIVASGRSHRHVGAIADRLIEDLKAKGVDDIRVEGLAHCDWVLVDLGDVLVHVFRPEVRGFYNLEKMWAAEPMAPRTPRSPEA
jgi:ribosome-associated protein